MRLILAALALIAPLALFAEDQAEKVERDWQSTCAEYGEFAVVFMRARQVGMPLADMMESFGDHEAFKQMLFDAYDRPRYHTESAQKRAVETFRDKWYLSCAKSLQK